MVPSSMTLSDLWPGFQGHKICFEVKYLKNGMSFDFLKCRHPPSWILHDVIANHPRLVFDGPNILLKLHIHRVIILLPDGQKRFKIGLAILTQYRRVTDTQPASQPAIFP